MPFFTRLRRASHFSLRGQREVTKRKATPHSRLAHSPCAPGARACYGVRRQSIRGLASNWPTSCGPSFGQFLHRPAASDGTLIARIVRAKATANSQSQSQSVREPALFLVRTTRSERGPLCSGKVAEGKPAGWARGFASSALPAHLRRPLHRVGLLFTPGSCATPSGPASLFAPLLRRSGYFSLGHAKRSDSLP